jgi:hypothetical protein
MIRYGDKVRLTDLAKELKVTSSAIRQHLHNKSGLGESAEKWGNHRTDDYLLPIDSVLNFLTWLKMKAKKVKMEDILRVEQELK